jgi:hypothetical protein
MFIDWQSCLAQPQCLNATCIQRPCPPCFLCISTESAVPGLWTGTSVRPAKLQEQRRKEASLTLQTMHLYGKNSVKSDRVRKVLYNTQQLSINDTGQQKMIPPIFLIPRQKHFQPKLVPSALWLVRVLPQREAFWACGPVGTVEWWTL